MKRYNRNKDKRESRKIGREFSDGFDVDFFVFKSISTRLLPTLWETTESIESRRMVSVRKATDSQSLHRKQTKWRNRWQRLEARVQSGNKRFARYADCYRGAILFKRKALSA